MPDSTRTLKIIGNDAIRYWVMTTRNPMVCLKFFEVAYPGIYPRIEALCETAKHTLAKYDFRSQLWLFLMSIAKVKFGWPSNKYATVLGEAEENCSFLSFLSDEDRETRVESVRRWFVDKCIEISAPLSETAKVTNRLALSMGTGDAENFEKKILEVFEVEDLDSIGELVNESF